jgi:Fe-S cluster biogenesis protein NfuA/nitrite reductase/ring-hydroxylating ferredoxin subunit
VAQLDKKEFRQRLQKIEDLVNTIETVADPNVRASAVELMQSLMELHGAGIERMMQIVFETGESGRQVIDQFGEDDLVASLLLLYGLHPLDLETRMLQALDKVRPYLRSHGGNVELLGINDGMARLRLQGSCNGCASSAMTLKLAIEDAIYDAAPDITGLEVEGVVARPAKSGFVQLEKSAGKNGAGAPVSESQGWEEVRGLSSLTQGAISTIEVSGRPVLFCHVGESYYAYSETCPECGRALKTAALEAAAIICPSCGQRFDALRAGRGLDKPGLYLEPFPLLVERGEAKIALPALQH